jgi:hypothetical protein
MRMRVLAVKMPGVVWGGRLVGSSVGRARVGRAKRRIEGRMVGDLLKAILKRGIVYPVEESTRRRGMAKVMKVLMR